MLFHHQHPGPTPRKINISNIATPTASENDFIENVLDPKTATQNEISNVYKNSVLSEIKKINDSLTENDFEISTDFMGKNDINLIANSNNFVLNIKGKNNADGQKVVNINVNKFILKNLSDVINGDVDSPTEFKVNDPKNVVKNELINALQPQIIKGIDDDLTETITENDFEIVIKKPDFNTQSRYDMSVPTQVIISLNGKNWLVGNSANDINIQMPSATKK
ncbi:hypothetical protein [Spiroplasma endosymbiont of Stenodema calcarata]|uniref:hypothetical protein n=1 Tax=Spiroplasma endosymbiont of Stenodema calcarata TaxID=3139328 RepID=UPI003CCAE316